MVTKNMGRIIAIDYGVKRVGIAVTDPLQLIATPLTTISSHKLFLFLGEYLQQEAISIFVIGLPLALNGQPSAMTCVVEAIGLRLKSCFPQQSFYYQDERFTSKMATQALYQAGYSKKDRRDKREIDKVSAAIILQSFLRRLDRLGER